MSVPEERPDEPPGYGERLRTDVDFGSTARAIQALATGHRLICGRTDTTDVRPARMHETWQAVLPLLATDEWLRTHPLPAVRPAAGWSVRPCRRRMSEGRDARGDERTGGSTA